MTLYDPFDEAELVENDMERRQEIQAAIDRVAATHGLQSTRNELGLASYAATYAYWRWWFQNAEKHQGIGSKDDTQSLERTLKRAHKLLRDPKIVNRLQTAINSLNKAELPSPPANIYYEFGETNFHSVRHARATIAGLLSIAERAAKLNGRGISTTRRSDIRSTAEPLRHYWVEVAKRKDKLGQSGGIYFPTVRFLYDSLFIIDPTVTERLIANLDK